MCTTSTSGAWTSSSADSNARSAPSAAAASVARSGDEAATPTRRAPANRDERAWTDPMNPVPAIAARTSPPDMVGEAIAPLARMSSKSSSLFGRAASTKSALNRKLPSDSEGEVWLTRRHAQWGRPLSTRTPIGAGRVLGLIRDRDETTRAELVRETGLSRSTLAKRVQDLLALGLVREVDGHASTGGRPPAAIVFNQRAGFVLAADVRSRAHARGGLRPRRCAAGGAGRAGGHRRAAGGAARPGARPVPGAARPPRASIRAAVRGIGVGLAPGWDDFSSRGLAGGALRGPDLGRDPGQHDGPG